MESVTEESGADESYDDFVEISYRSITSEPWIVDVPGTGHRLPDLTDGPGDYRLRCHARRFGREAAARRRVEGLRKQIAELTERLVVEEDRVSRLVVTRETVEEILGEATELVGEPDGEAGAADSAEVGEESPDVMRLGVVTVPRWRSGLGTKVLPQAYRDAVGILVDAGEPMRAGQVLVAMGRTLPELQLYVFVPKTIHRRWYAFGRGRPIVGQPTVVLRVSAGLTFR